MAGGKELAGAEKAIATAGHAGWNPDCAYYRITAGQVHAWVGYGSHRKTDRIRDLGWQACGTKVSERQHTAFVERVNLTIYQGVALLVRRTWGTAQTAGVLYLHLLWWQGCGHFVRPHQVLRQGDP